MRKLTTKVLLVLIMVSICSSLSVDHRSQQQQQHDNLQKSQQHLRRSQPITHSHKYWFNKNHPTDFILSSARQWNYCDYKCLYLERYNLNKDFVVVVMGAFLKQDFSACYVKNGQDYTLWNQIMTNKFYEQNCGQDDKDWMKSGQFTVKGIYGVGIGTMLNETEIYK